MAIETRDDLLAALANLDTASIEELEALDQQIAEAEAAIENAGSEYDQQIEDGQTAVTDAISEYNGLATTAQTKQESAAAAAEAVTESDATDEIAAITSIIAPAVSTNDVVDIQAAIDALVSQLNDRITAIKAMGTALNNPDAIGGLKTAATDLAASNAAIITGAMPLAEDTQPQIDEDFEFIDGLV
jgi:hypothetical protein